MKDYKANKRVWGRMFLAFLIVHIILLFGFKISTGITELMIIISGIMWAINAVKAKSSEKRQSNTKA